eukprot:augustus_masked-scaffold_3-processed-gene-9.56-mRNA-1 protein AED:0.35 eAED:0.35 QI:0/-1/0/1/-1/1/1/0/387
MGNVTSRNGPCGCLFPKTKIEKKMAADKSQGNSIRKVLLLGPGDSGKTTIFKQMKLANSQREGIHQTPTTQLRSHCIHNLLKGAKDLVEQIDRSKDEPIMALLSQDKKFEKSFQILKGQRPGEPLSFGKELGEAFEIFWTEKHVQRFWKDNWTVSSVPQSFSKFADDCVENWKNVDPKQRWGSEQWAPNPEDEILFRIQTTGVVFQDFKGLHPNLILRMIDVGGQRSERAKWLPVFHDINTVLFVVSISDYNQVLYEAEDVNRLKESLSLFESTIPYSNFSEEVDFIIFLNKVDLFEQKIVEHKIPISVSKEFPDAPKLEDGSDDFDLYRNKEWMANKFRAVFQKQRPRSEFYKHFTVATDSLNIFKVLDSVKTAVLKKNFDQFGFF